MRNEKKKKSLCLTFFFKKKERKHMRVRDVQFVKKLKTQ